MDKNKILELFAFNNLRIENLVNQ